MSQLSLPAQLSEDTVQNIVNHFGMTEVHDENGGPFMTLISHAPMAQGEVGSVRVFEGGGLDRLITCSIVVPAMMLDSHMLYGFTPKTSAIPHFTLDSVKAGEHFAFHLDMTPRVDLAQHIGYMNEVFHPLTEKFDAAEAIEGITKAHISPRQRAIMSPWMLVHRADEAGFAQLTPHLDGYLNHWYDLHTNGVTSPISEEELVARDKANRAAIFDPEIDPVWNRIQGLIGEDAVSQLRSMLKGES
ncbi:hypothetical protein RGQ13_19095 [Thalassotalea psychrophila]|uniref:Uncharacterized protein n=1 Tax=Thalassotalea psychrophila TaxID=3065647 RepID=A0ABY9TTX3_9GAMM|nr:hypothetical protein RGQ13_19095 [Colwelliaceae bacterium SQ149]